MTNCNSLQLELICWDFMGFISTTISLYPHPSFLMHACCLMNIYQIPAYIIFKSELDKTLDCFYVNLILIELKYFCFSLLLV